ncbi:MAG: cobaltochelatase subunit CobN, partial [Alphaproteobacteria bacterium]|nr:cobaltochelatase subunit CobN [Alphaproteobacteria bacterium]
QQAAELVVARYLQEHGDYPRVITMTIWGTAEMRTAGESIAAAMALMGTTPRWDESSGRVLGFTILPSSSLERPRVWVNLRISGFFRDAFPHLIDLFDRTARAVQQLDETDDKNAAAAHYRALQQRLTAAGIANNTASDLAGATIFGPAPDSYGTGLQQLLDNETWQERPDLAKQFLHWTSHYYGQDQRAEKVVANHGNHKNNHPVMATANQDNIFHQRLAASQIIMQNQDNREHDILDSDDYYQFQGGLYAAASWLQQQWGGTRPIAQYHNDHSNPLAPRVATLTEEIGRVVRARATTPKWLTRIRQEGYKGGFEMAATLDYLFAFAATTNAVSSHHFDLLFDHYLADNTNVAFLRDHNLPALHDMAKKFD